MEILISTKAYEIKEAVLQVSEWSIQRLEDVIDVNPAVKLKKGEPYPFIDIDFY